MILYLHGFASSPQSYKAQRFQRGFAALGIDITIPALDEGDFTGLTLTRQRRVIARAAAERPPGEPLVLIGSSMGGYLALLHATAHPVTALVLMAPAVDFLQRWRERLGPAALQQWREQGTLLVDHVAQRRPLPLSYALMEDADLHPPMPPACAPALVLQGVHDPVVPLDRVQRWAAGQSSVTLLTFDAGHELTECVDDLFTQTLRFLAALPAVAAAYPALCSVT